MRDWAEVIDFWFTEHAKTNWFSGDTAFDAEVENRFENLHKAVATGETWQWRKKPLGRLAEIIVLDQFSRQIFRDAAKAFATDSMALVLAQELVAHKTDAKLSTDQRMFAYMPYMHSESLLIHNEAIRLFTALGNNKVLEFEMQHQYLIKRFGRYPKRNIALGRASTDEELDYIAQSEGMF